MSQETFASTPYKGLMPYSEEDAPFFFGRDAEREIITSNLMASRLTLLYGPSGVGKSSVLRAGVAHHLRRLARENLDETGSPQFAVVVFNSWRDNPIAGLEARVRESAMQALNGQAIKPVPPLFSLEEACRAWAEQVGGELLIVLDQFEEYFLYHGQEDGDDTFAAQFPRVVNSSDLSVNFLISIREDALAKLDLFQGRIPSLFDNRLPIAHLDRNAGRAAIKNPVEQFNRLYAAGRQRISIEPALVETVLDQVKTGEVVLGESGRGIVKDEAGRTQIETPYLQLVMERLWNEEIQAGSRDLRLATLNRLGGAESIVRTHLDAFMRTLAPNEQDIASDVFHYLVTPSGTKIAHIASDLATLAERSEAEVTGVLEKLSPGDVRILRPVDPPPDRPRARRFEIFHDVLAPAILNWRTQYVQAQERIDAERRAEEQRVRADEQARIARRLRRLAAALALVSLLAAGAAAFALVKQSEAREERIKAEGFRAEGNLLREKAAELEAGGQRLEAAGRFAQFQAHQEHEEARRQAARAEEQAELASTRKQEADTERGRAEAESKRALELASQTRVGFSNLLAAQAKGSLDESPPRSLLLAVEALKAPQADDPPVPAAETTLREVLSETGSRVLTGHSATITNVAVSSTNRWLASADEHGDTYLWDLSIAGPSANQRKLVGAHSPFAFSRNERWLVTATERSNQSKMGLLLWDLTAPDPASNPRAIPAFADNLDVLEISHDNRWLVSGTTRRAANWSVFSGRKVPVRLLNLTRPDSEGATMLLPGDANFVMGVSPDGRWMATDSWNESNKEGKTITLWDMRAENPIANPLVLSGHTGQVTAVVFSPDGHWLATSSGDCSYGTDTSVRLWNLTVANPGKEPTVLSKHERPVTGLVFSEGDETLITGGDGDGVTGCKSDNVCFGWDLGNTGKAPIALRGRGKPVAIVGDELLVTQQSEFFTRLSALDDQDDFTLDLKGAFVGRSADNRFVLTTSVPIVENLTLGLLGESKPVVRLWDLKAIDEERQAATILRGHEEPPSSFFFSPNGGLLATAGKDKTIRLWNISNMPSSIRSSSVVLCAGTTEQLLKSDGRWLVTTNPGGLKVYDLTSEDPRRKPIILSEGAGEVVEVAVSSKHRWLVTMNEGRAVHLWDMRSAPSRRDLKSFPSPAQSLTISRDEHWLAVGYADGTARLWDLSLPNRTLEPQRTFTTRQSDPSAPAAGGPLHTIQITADNRWLIAGSSTRSASHLWDLSSGAGTQSIDLGEVDSTTVSPDGRWLVFSEFRTVKLWDLSSRNPKLTTQTLKGAEWPYVFSPDSRWLFTGKEGWGALLWNPKSPEHPLSLPNQNPGRVESAVFSPDLTWVAARSKGDIVWLWKLNDLGNQPIILKGDPLGIESIDISADSRWLQVTTFPTIRLFDLRRPTDAPITLSISAIEGRRSLVGFGLASPDTRWLVLASEFSSRPAPTELLPARSSDLVDAACRTAGRNLTCKEWENYFPGQAYRSTCPSLPPGKCP